MFARCSQNNHIIQRYSEDQNAPCDECGDPIMWVTHLGLPLPYNIPQHEILMNVVTGERLSPDPCDNLDLFKGKG